MMVLQIPHPRRGPYLVVTGSTNTYITHGPVPRCHTSHTRKNRSLARPLSHTTMSRTRVVPVIRQPRRAGPPSLGTIQAYQSSLLTQYNLRRPASITAVSLACTCNGRGADYLCLAQNLTSKAKKKHAKLNPIRNPVGIPWPSSATENDRKSSPRWALIVPSNG